MHVVYHKTILQIHFKHNSLVVKHFSWRTFKQFQQSCIFNIYWGMCNASRNLFSRPCSNIQHGNRASDSTNRMTSYLSILLKNLPYTYHSIILPKSLWNFSSSSSGHSSLSCPQDAIFNSYIQINVLWIVGAPTMILLLLYWPLLVILKITNSFLCFLSASQFSVKYKHLIFNPICFYFAHYFHTWASSKEYFLKVQIFDIHWFSLIYSACHILSKFQ